MAKTPINFGYKVLTDYHRENVNYYKPVYLRLRHHIQRLLKIQHYMMEVYEAPVSIEQIAGRFQMSPRNLTKIFKNQLGITSAEFLKTVWISHAVELPESEDKSIKEVMYSTGYNDRSAFRRAFRKIVGLTPRE